MDALSGPQKRILLFYATQLLGGGLGYGFQAFQSLLLKDDSGEWSLVQLKWFPSVAFCGTTVLSFVSSVLLDNGASLRRVTASGLSTVMLGGALIATTKSWTNYTARKYVPLAGFGLLGVGGGLLTTCSVISLQPLTNNTLPRTATRLARLAAVLTSASNASSVLVFMFDSSSLWAAVWNRVGSLVGFGVFVAAAMAVLLALHARFLENMPPTPPIVGTTAGDVQDGAAFYVPVGNDDGDDIHPVTRTDTAPRRPSKHIVALLILFHIIVVFAFYFYIATQLEQTQAHDNKDNKATSRQINSLFNLALPVGSLLFTLLAVYKLNRLGAPRLLMVVCVASVVMYSTLIIRSPYSAFAGVVLTPLLRLSSWSAFVQCAQLLQPGSTLAYGVASLLIGLASLASQPVNSALNGHYGWFNAGLALSVAVVGAALGMRLYSAGLFRDA